MRCILFLLDWFRIAIVSGASPALFRFFRAMTKDRSQAAATTGIPDVSSSRPSRCRNVPAMTCPALLP